MNPIVATIISLLLLYWGIALVASSLIGDDFKTAIFQRILAAVVLLGFVVLTLN